MVSVYFLTVRAFERSVLFLRACLNGAWLGVLGRGQLHAVDGTYYLQRADSYANSAWNARGLQAWERRIVDGDFGGCTSVLVTSVGGGRELLALAQLGYEVDGFECHPDLLECARALVRTHGLRARVVEAPRDGCPYFERTYDGVVVGWGSYMLIQGRARRIEFLKRLRAHARDGAPILLSFYTRAFDGAYFRVVMAVGNVFRRLRRRERVELGDDLAPNYVHYFNESEIASELREAGFELRAFSTAGYGHAVGRAVVSAEPTASHAVMGI